MRLYAKTLILFVSALILMAFPRASSAQDNALATAEDIAIAFYKTAGRHPPYETWVKSNAPYNLTPLARRPDILEQEIQRLAKLYQNFSPRRDVINIQTNVKLIPHSETDPLSDEMRYFLKIDIGSPIKNFYFPYSYNDQNFMLVPSYFERFQKLPIHKRTYDQIMEATSPKYKVPINISMVSDKADMTQPYMVDNMPQWLISMDIVSMESWGSNGQLIWQYTTQGYTPEKTKELQDLYQEPDKDVQVNQIIQSIN